MLALRIWIGVTIALTLIATKWSSLRVSRLAPADRRSMLVSPVFSVASWKKRQRVDERRLRNVLEQLTAFAFALGACWWAYLHWVPVLRPSVIAQGYLGALPLYLLIQFASSVLELLWWPTGWHYPAHMRFPPAAQRLDEFWGRRWGTFVADWMRQVILNRYRRRPALGLVAVFAVSGLWHEVLIDLPLYIFCGVNVLGGWLLYFAIQAAGVFGERLLFRRRSVVGWLYTWTVVVVPAPLAMNQATLSALGLFVP